MNIQSKNEYEVIIIGAGPAGSTLGYLLAGSGHDILVVDREHFPRAKLCGGSLSWKTKHLVEEIFQVRFEDTFPIKHASDIVFLYEKTKEISRCQASKPFIYVERESYDSALVSLAKNQGCHFVFGESVQHVDMANNTIFTKSGLRLSGKIMVSAEGVNSRMRKQLISSKERKASLALAFQVDIPNENSRKEFKKPAMRIFFGFSNYGYGWIFPFGEYSKVGLSGLILKNKNMYHNFKSFLSEVTEFDPEGQRNFKSHLIPSGMPLTLSGAERTLLIGDAAGLVDPYSGEGIYYAHKSAECAYRAILLCLNSGKYTHLVRSYREYLRPVLYELRLAKRLREIIYRNKLRSLAFSFIKKSEIYTKFTKITHGQRSYARITGLSLGIRYKKSLNG